MIEPGITPGQAVALASGLQRVTAANASPMTGPGTNTYIVGQSRCVVVDPAMDEASHLATVMAACPGPIQGIALTHRHPDHAGGAEWLAEKTGAPILAWPKPEAGEHDRAVSPVNPLHEGQCWTVGEVSMIVWHTPGHASDHVVFELPQFGVALAGDVVMVGGRVVILPPDGHMGDYFRTLDRLAGLDLQALAPAHGQLMYEPAQVIASFRRHRQEREQQIVELLTREHRQDIASLTTTIYPQLTDSMKGMAERQVAAHLQHLVEQGQADEAQGGFRRLV